MLIDLPGKSEGHGFKYESVIADLLKSPSSALFDYFGESII